MSEVQQTPRKTPQTSHPGVSSPPNSNPSDPAAPGRTGAKKRHQNSVDAPDTTVSNGPGPVKSRVTRRELKKLTEMDLEEKQEIPGAGQPAAKAIGQDTSSKTTPSSLHDDFVNLMKAQGLEKMATEAGLMKDGALVDIKQEPGTETPRTEKPTSANAKRPLSAMAAEASSPSYSSPSSKKRKYAKINKGLRHFSMKVCQKVEEKNVTTYNEVADELVREFVTLRPNDAVYDEKNIRRRVYDALNVLMAMDIISKERKEIRWKGLPTSLQHDAEVLIAERNERMRSLEQKKQHLQDLLVQQVAMKNLLKRNSKRRKESPSELRDEGRIFLPFIVVNTNKDTVIQCEMSEDRQDIFFNFSNPFEINDDTEVLRRLNLHKCPFDELKQIVPEKLLSYLPAECESKSEEN